jgi:hypothetical protein
VLGRPPLVEAGDRRIGGAAGTKATVKGSPREVKELALMGAASSSGKEPSLSSSLRNTNRSSIIQDGWPAAADGMLAALRS